MVLDTIEDIKCMVIKSSSKSLIKYILCKIYIFFCSRILNTLKAEINLLSCDNFRYFTKS